MDASEVEDAPRGDLSMPGRVFATPRQEGRFFSVMEVVEYIEA